MKIGFINSSQSNPSFTFYSRLLSHINNMPEDKTVLSLTDINVSNLHEFNVILLMGSQYTHDLIQQLRARGKFIIGLIDPRPSLIKLIKNVDFIIANGIDSRDLYFSICDNIFIYYVFPLLNQALETKRSNTFLTIGYHGNKIHLDAMFPRITDALCELSRTVDLTLKACYNISLLGRSKVINERLPFPIEHIQYSEENLIKKIGSCHIGVVPQLMPIQRQSFIRKFSSTAANSFNEESNDYLVRYKATTNIGRCLVFAQMGIPFITDLTPSSAALVDYGVNGYYAYSTSSWLRALYKLSASNAYRIEIAAQMRKTFNEVYTPEVQNARLISFLKDILGMKL